MDEAIKTALKRAILQSLPILREIAPGCQEPYLFWTKDELMGWRGETRPRTSLRRVFMIADTQLQEAAGKFDKLFFEAFPEYGPGKMVRVLGLTGEQLAHQPGMILERALAFLWHENESFEWTESASPEGTIARQLWQ